MRWLCAVALLFGCYREPFSDEDCTITCSGGGTSCPGDLTCQGGYCVSEGQVCKPSFVHVAAGTGFACGIDEGAALWCWGSNLHHQISVSDQLSYSLATRVDTTRHWQALDAGGEHVCGIADGKLLCWGANDRGQVSDTLSGDVASPLEITFLDAPATWSIVATGIRTTCAIGDGRLFCWGANGNSQLGDGTQTDRGVPTPILATTTDWLSVAVGDRHACASSQSGGVYCWGSNSAGQAGPNAANPQRTPASVPITAKMLAVSASATCATTTDGELLCWGSNGYGELGEANQALSQTTTPLKATQTMGWTSIAASQDSLCGVRDNQIVCWGATTFGGLGDGYWQRMAGDHVFAAVGGTTGATEIAIGWNERIDVVTGGDPRDLTLACALVGTDILCWGDNRFGQLAMGRSTMAVSPGPIAGDPLFTDLAAGQFHACGVQDGVVSCWGSTEYGAATGVYAGGSAKACNPNLDCDVATPKPLNFFSAHPSTDVALGAISTCAFHAGTITCWGDNSQLQLGTGAAAPRERDVPGPGGATWTGILSTGRLGQCAVYRSGMIDATACWGYALQSRTGPTPIAALNSATAIVFGAAPNGAGFDCILDATGTLQCQGDNQSYEYGDGTTVQVGTLTTVNPPRTYTALAAHAVGGTLCGLKADQTVECWGNNDRGQTAALSGALTTTPNAIAGLSSCTAIAVGRYHACAVCDGSIACWGDNRLGQLGSGTLDADPQPTPKTIAGRPPQGAWNQLVAGFAFTCARSDAGLSQCWGFERHAALGNGARSANLPVLVGASPAQ